MTDARTKNCANCGATTHADALFCESCGYDFTTGALPRPMASILDLDGQLFPEHRDEDLPIRADGSVSSSKGTAVSESMPLVAAPQSLSSVPEPVEGIVANVEAPLPVAEQISWVAEVWVDPDWYAVQQADDQMPPAGLPDVVGLRKREILIGRPSRSRGIAPEIDAKMDTSCSRRQAQLTFDGTRWYVEDLDSANGTFVGPAGALLPEEPIGRGRRALADGDRIYVGAWTRIVVRHATPDEIKALA